MTPPPASHPAQVPPFGAMLRATVLPMVATAPVIVLAFWVTRQSAGALAALLGVVVAIAFFAGGLHVMARVVKANPMLVLAGALAVYLGQVLFLGVVILSLSGARWLDGTAFGLSILAVALIWQVAQVVAFVRLRQPLYDDPAAHSAAAAEHSAGHPAGHPAGHEAGHAAGGPVAGPTRERLP